MKRRTVLAMTGAGTLVGLSGCIDEIQGVDPDQSDDDTAEPDDDETSNRDDENDDEEMRPQEEMCPEPPDKLTEIEYGTWTTSHYSTAGTPTLLEDGYWELDHRTDDNRVSIITEETTDRLNLSALDGDTPLTGPEDANEPTFIEETDFETSALIVFPWRWSGDENIAIEAVGLENDDTVHIYCCRVGDPWAGGGGEPPGGRVYTFFRVSHTPATAKITFSFREFATPRETETYVAEVEDERS
ncbi:hypothetical protein OB905_07885 [Halobacteria archaeon AArc-dxtr1]|nr:hypothetical protein [Halobacteria archaeon AArc-dxtr1]